MKRVIAALMRGVLNAAYWLFTRAPRRNLVAFLSRQSLKRSHDFERLGAAFTQEDGWEVCFLQKTLDNGVASKLGYAFHMLREVKLLARCKICFVEGYDPALSMLDLESVDLGGGAPNHTAPTSPVVFQLWHAGGMFKKFGYQIVDTPQGRSAQDAQLFRMHRNYSWVVCSGEGVRDVYARALGCPVERVVALGRPSCDALYEDAEQGRARALRAYPELASGRPVVVFAPTLRRNGQQRPFDALRTQLEGSDWAQRYTLLWSDHPVVHEDERVSTVDLMRVADIVVTDYSSVVYDAALLKLPFAFYVPDLDEYRASPGMNTDPGVVCPGLSLADAGELRAFIDAVVADAGTYPQQQADAFIGDALSACSPGSTQRIVDFALQQVGES